MEAAGYPQANLVNNIATHMYVLPFTYPPKESEYTQTRNTAPTIMPTVQPTPVANVATDVSNIPPPPDTDQHATYSATADSDARKTNIRGRTNKQLQHLYLPGSN